MGRIFEPAEWHGSFPAYQTVVYDSAETFGAGAPVITAADGEVTVAAADPTQIMGIAMHAAGTGPGFSIAGGVTQVTNRANEVTVCVVDADTVFSGRMTNAGATVAPLQTHVGEEYGIIAVSGEWTIDETETTTKSVHIVDVDLLNGIHYFRFISTVPETV